MQQEMTKKPLLTAAQKRNRKLMRQRIIRAVIQLFFFITMPGAFVAGFTGVKHIFQWIGAGEMLEMNSFVRVLIGLALFTILFGRFFCGYICAFGSLGDLVYGVSGLVQKHIFHRKKQISLPTKALPWLQKLKYILLALIVVLCTLGLYQKLTGTSPWDVFSRLTALQGIPEGYFWGTLVFVLILLGMAVQERFFCQFLCPMGAVFSLLPILPWGSLKRNQTQCPQSCKICVSQCPVGLRLETDGFRNGECVGCERCAGACPRGNIAHAEQKLLGETIVPLLLKAALFFAMGLALGLCRF